MKKVICIVFALCLAGCTTLIKKPQILSVKKIAIVSIYANADLHDVKAPKNPTSTLSFLTAMMGKEKDKSIESNELVQIVTYGLKAYGEQLDSISNWSVLPPLEVLKSNKYQELMKEGNDSFMGELLKALKKAEGSQWVTPPAMPRIPADSLTRGKGRTVIIKGQRDPVKYAQMKMAELCKELEVDAVAIVGLDLAYKSGMLSGMKGTGLLSGVRGKATPAVASEIIVITKNAEIVVESKLLSQGGTYSYSYSVPMMMKGKPNLQDSNGKSVEAYYSAVKKSAEVLKKQINKELSK